MAGRTSITIAALTLLVAVLQLLHGVLGVGVAPVQVVREIVDAPAWFGGGTTRPDADLDTEELREEAQRLFDELRSDAEQGRDLTPPDRPSDALSRPELDLPTDQPSPPRGVAP